MISNSGHDENGRYSSGAAGDQTGGEWARINWYNRPWNVVLRYPDITVGALMAQLAGEAADNNKIGYDQNQRRTFYNQLKAVGWFPKSINTACESDCSAGVTAITIAAGNILGIEKLKSLSPDIYTGNMKSAFKSAGFLLLTESKYLTSDNYLMPGDVLLYEGHHTAINLDWGTKTTMPTFTVESYISSVTAFARTARAGNYTYGDSHSLPPSADHVTSCDRGTVARPLYDLGFKNQPAGGITVINMESYLTSWGFSKITNQNALKRGDIVLMKKVGESKPTAAWHTFVLTDFKNVNNVSKFDFGSQERIRSYQPFTLVPLNQWPGSKEFYCAFRYGKSDETSYTFSPSDLKKGTKNNSAYLATEILKARDYQGVKDKNGKIQDLELNFDWTKGDMAAMAHYKWDRIVNGTNLCRGPYGAGEVGPKDWADLLGGNIPFTVVELPTKQKSGTSVLLCQEILRSRGVKGADGKPIQLSQKWDENLEFAVKTYQKVRGLKQTGKVTTSVWKDMLGTM